MRRQQESPPIGSARGGAGQKIRRVALFFVLGLGGCAADLASKAWVFDWLGTPPQSTIYWVWEHFVGLECSINQGALFGMGQGRVLFFAVVSCLALVGVLIWVLFGSATEDLRVTLALGLILGGVLGNLYDRLGLWGQVGVRDWIRISYYDYVWPNFNIADSLLVVGACVLVWHAFRQPQEAGDRPQDKKDAAERVGATGGALRPADHQH